MAVYGLSKIGLDAIVIYFSYQIKAENYKYKTVFTMFMISLVIERSHSIHTHLRQLEY